MKPRDIAFLLVLVTVIGTVKAEPDPIFFIDLWKPIEAIFKLIGKIDFGDFGNIIKIKGDGDSDSKKDTDSKKDDDSKKEHEKESEDDEDSDDEWEFEHDFDFLDRNLKNVPNPETADPVEQSYKARSGDLPEANINKAVSETADIVEVAKEDLKEVAKRSVTNYGGGMNKRNVNFELLPKESIRVKRAMQTSKQLEGARKDFFKAIDVMRKYFGREKRSKQVTNYRTAKRHVENEPTSELNLLEKLFWDLLIDTPIDSRIVERDASSLQGLIERFLVATDRMRQRLKESKVDKRYAM